MSTTAVVEKKKSTKKSVKPAKNRLKGVMTPEQAAERGVGGADGNGAADTSLGTYFDEGPQVDHAGPYEVDTWIEMESTILSHAYNVDLIEWLGGLGKGAVEKKKDYPELTCFWDRPFLPNPKGKPPFKKDPKAFLCGSTDWLHRAIAEQGRRERDPAAAGGRRNAKDLLTAGVLVFGEGMNPDVTPFYVAPAVGGAAAAAKYVKTHTWDYLDKRRVVVNHQAVPRVRAAMAPGARLHFVIRVLMPEYIPINFLRKVVDAAGQLQGLADFRPKFGRFKVVQWELVDLS